MRLVSGVGLIAGVVLAGAGTYLLLTTSSNEGASGEHAPRRGGRARLSPTSDSPSSPVARCSEASSSARLTPGRGLRAAVRRVPPSRVPRRRGRRRERWRRRRERSGRLVRGYRRPRRRGRGADRHGGVDGGGTAGSAGGAGGVNATGGTGGAVTGVGGTTAGTVAVVPAGAERPARAASPAARPAAAARPVRRAPGAAPRAAAARPARRAPAAAARGAVEPPARGRRRRNTEAAGPAARRSRRLVAVDRGRLSVRWAAGADSVPRRTATRTLHLEETPRQSVADVRYDERHRGQFGPPSRAAERADVLPQSLGRRVCRASSRLSPGRASPRAAGSASSIAQQQPAVPDERRRPGALTRAGSSSTWTRRGQLRRARASAYCRVGTSDAERQLQGGCSAGQHRDRISAAGPVAGRTLVCRFDAATNQLSIFVAGSRRDAPSTRSTRSSRARVRSWSAAT